MTEHSTSSPSASAPTTNEEPSDQIKLSKDVLWKPNHVLSLLLGFALGALMVYFLRTELRDLRSLAPKLGIAGGMALLLLFLIRPLYVKSVRAIEQAFAHAQARALVQTLNFAIIFFVTSLFVLAGLYFAILM